MEQSTELRDLILRSYEALSSGDLSFFERHISQQDGVLAIGTDPNEWWAGFATITRVFKTQMEEMGRFTISEANVQFRHTARATSDGRPTDPRSALLMVQPSQFD